MPSVSGPIVCDTSISLHLELSLPSHANDLYNDEIINSMAASGIEKFHTLREPPATLHLLKAGA